MPIYEYECTACGHQLEAIQKFSDAPLTECPACGKSALKKMVSVSGFRLKGTGWYETDFKGGGKKTENKASDSGSSTSSNASGSCCGGTCGK
jgi:putative FmdB family regulatory protein